MVEKRNAPNTGGRRSFTLAFLRTEAGAGAVLAVAAVAALIAANSPMADAYFGFVHQPVTITVGGFNHTESILEWTKEGLMTVFFFIVGLEIKYEALVGELSNRRRLALPVIAALGGMAVPALVYLTVNAASGGDPRGWSVPVATDIAFALGALAVLGRGLPPSLRLFLLTLAIVDDLGAVVLIAALFSRHIQVLPLLGALLTLAMLALLSRTRRPGPLVYGVGLIAVWALTFESGVSPALAGVATALTVPVRRRAGEETETPARDYLDALHPYVAYGVLPFFAFVAAGVSFQGLSPGQMLAPMPLGIALGLIVGKTLGVFSAAWLAVTLRLGAKPKGASWSQVLAVSAFCGVGFTMSLFLGSLSFGAHEEAAQTAMRLGVIGGTLGAMLLGALLTLASRRAPAPGAASN